MWLWQFQNFTHKSHVQHGFARIPLGWDTQWCLNSCLMVKHLELARVIYSLCNFNFQTSINPLFVKAYLDK